MDLFALFTPLNPPSPGLSNSIVSNDYSNLPVSFFRIRIEVYPVSADAFECEPVDDNIPLLAFVGGRVHSINSYGSFHRRARGIGTVLEPHAKIRCLRIPIPAPRGHRPGRPQN